MPRDNLPSLRIRTPEGVVFAMTLAGPLVRFLAWLVDFASVAVLLLATEHILKIVGALHADVARAISILAYFVLSIGYSIALEWYWNGQTCGKRLLRLRVVDAQGLRLQVGQVVIRNLVRFVDSLPGLYLVGGVVCLGTRLAQRLGDIAANTVVIRLPLTNPPDFEQLLAGKYNSLRAYPHLAARLRQQTSPQEANLALQAILRRDQLTPAARVQLFGSLAAYFRVLVDFPQEAFDGLSDEQYVRNVLDVLFRTPQGVRLEHGSSQ